MKGKIFLDDETVLEALQLWMDQQFAIGQAPEANSWKHKYGNGDAGIEVTVLPAGAPKSSK